MNPNSTNSTLQVIDVPPELRGMTDEEIILNSEKPRKIFNGKRKNGAARPSKRDRLSAIFHHSGANLSQIPPISKLPSEKQILLNTAFTPNSNSLSIHKFEDLPKTEAKREIHASTLSEIPTPTTGRVLKAAFGIKGKDKPKAVIVSAADLAKQKAEERAKKIQAFFRAKHPEATTMPDGQPIKRGRGRPRKNPVI